MMGLFLKVILGASLIDNLISAFMRVQHELVAVSEASVPLELVEDGRSIIANELGVNDGWEIVPEFSLVLLLLHRQLVNEAMVDLGYQNVYMH